MTTSDVLALAAAQRAALARRDAAVLARLTSAYTALYRRLAAQIELLGDALAALPAPTRGQVERLARYRTLLAQLNAELRDYSGFARTEMGAAADAAIGQAGRDALALAAAANPAVLARWDALPAGAIRAALAFLQPDGPLFQRLQQLAPFTAERVAATIVDSITIGRNPRQWAGLIRDALGGGLTDALRMARTVQLYSYRESARANYIANSDVVQGWVWTAELDADTCLSCVAQHGTVHPLDEALNDHHNGRCAAVPLVVGADNPVAEGGREWFERLSATQQQAMLGAERYDAWQAGRFEFSALSREREDSVYGLMKSEASLKELIGA